jgi:hypothetical protein
MDLSGYENQQVETEAVATARVFTAQTLPTAKQTNKQTNRQNNYKETKEISEANTQTYNLNISLSFMFFAGNPAVSFISVSFLQCQQSKQATLQTCITNKETTTCLYFKARSSQPS